MKKQEKNNRNLPVQKESAAQKRKREREAAKKKQNDEDEFMELMEDLDEYN